MALETLGKTTEEVQDIVGSLIVGSGDANVTYDDANHQLSVDVSTLTNEQVEDTVVSLVSSDSNLSWSYDDSGDTLTISLADSISVSTLEAGGWSFIGAFQTLSDFESAASSDDYGFITSEQQFAYES